METIHRENNHKPINLVQIKLCFAPELPEPYENIFDWNEIRDKHKFIDNSKIKTNTTDDDLVFGFTDLRLARNAKHKDYYYISVAHEPIHDMC